MLDDYGLNSPLLIAAAGMIAALIAWVLPRSFRNGRGAGAASRSLRGNPRVDEPAASFSPGRAQAARGRLR